MQDFIIEVCDADNGVSRFFGTCDAALNYISGGDISRLAGEVDNVTPERIGTEWRWRVIVKAKVYEEDSILSVFNGLPDELYYVSGHELINQ